MSDLEAAVAAGVIGAEEAHRALLQATVEVARAIFRAKAASVFLLDEEAEELVFEAVAGEGEGEPDAALELLQALEKLLRQTG